jgi:hypothetical protein
MFGICGFVCIWCDTDVVTCLNEWRNEYRHVMCCVCGMCCVIFCKSDIAKIHCTASIPHTIKAYV